MGNVICKQKKLSGGARADNVNEAAGQAPAVSGAQTHVILIAIDYKGTGNELTCTRDGANMQQLCQACGVNDVTVLFDNDGNKGQVTQAIQATASRCNPGDFFIFYYSGHGTEVTDANGDERDGKDEALCLVTPNGELDWDQFMTDDELAELMIDNVDPSVNLIILADCCHSGTIADFDSADWGDIHGAAMSGCRDSQTSGDTGNGGIFTHSLLMAIAEKKREGDDDYSVGQLYNVTCDKDDDRFNSKQDITGSWSDAAGSLNAVAWPLVPNGPYQSPMQG